MRARVGYFIRFVTSALKNYQWMIGGWISRDKAAIVRNQCEWTKNKNFLKRSFSIRGKDAVNVEGTQFIGWDASTEQIRSWSFDSEGGFEQAAWTSSSIVLRVRISRWPDNCQRHQ